jgi:hypothetical protein
MVTQFPLTTTLAKIRAAGPEVKCFWEGGLAVLQAKHSEDDPISYTEVLDSFCFEQVLRCLQLEPEHSMQWRRFAVWCAKQNQHLIKDFRAVTALMIAERFLKGLVGDWELSAACVLARAAFSEAESKEKSATGFVFLATNGESVWMADAFESILPASDQIAALKQLVTTGTLP